MKKWQLILVFIFISLLFCVQLTQAQCAICSKTAAQMGAKPAKGLNEGILYLMATPYAIVGVIAYKWWKRQKLAAAEENQ